MSDGTALDEQEPTATLLLPDDRGTAWMGLYRGMGADRSVVGRGPTDVAKSLAAG